MGAPTRKHHIRSRKDPPPEQTLFGQRLIWSDPIWPCRFRLWEEGRTGVGAGASWELQEPGPGGHCRCSNTRLSRSLALGVPERVAGWRRPPLLDGRSSRHSGSSWPVLPY